MALSPSPNPQPPPPHLNEDSSSSKGPFDWWMPGATTGAKVGVLAAIVGVLVLLGVMFWYVWRRWKRQTTGESRELDDQEILGPNALKELFFSPSRPANQDMGRDGDPSAAYSDGSVWLKEEGRRRYQSGMYPLSLQGEGAAAAAATAATAQPQTRLEYIPAPAAASIPSPAGTGPLQPEDSLSQAGSTAYLLGREGPQDWAEGSPAPTPTPHAAGEGPKHGLGSVRGVDGPISPLEPQGSTPNGGGMLFGAYSYGSSAAGEAPQPAGTQSLQQSQRPEHAALQRITAMMCPGVPALEQRLQAVLQEALHGTSAAQASGGPYNTMGGSPPFMVLAGSTQQYTAGVMAGTQQYAAGSVHGGGQYSGISSQQRDQVAPGPNGPSDAMLANGNRAAMTAFGDAATANAVAAALTTPQLYSGREIQPVGGAPMAPAWAAGAGGGGSFAGWASGGMTARDILTGVRSPRDMITFSPPQTSPQDHHVQLTVSPPGLSSSAVRTPEPRLFPALLAAQAASGAAPGPRSEPLRPPRDAAADARAQAMHHPSGGSRAQSMQATGSYAAPPPSQQQQHQQAVYGGYRPPYGAAAATTTTTQSAQDQDTAQPSTPTPPRPTWGPAKPSSATQRQHSTDAAATVAAVDQYAVASTKAPPTYTDSAPLTPVLPTPPQASESLHRHVLKNQLPAIATSSAIGMGSGAFGTPETPTGSQPTTPNATPFSANALRSRLDESPFNNLAQQMTQLKQFQAYVQSAGPPPAPGPSSSVAAGRPQLAPMASGPPTTGATGREDWPSYRGSSGAVAAAGGPVPGPSYRFADATRQSSSGLSSVSNYNADYSPDQHSNSNAEEQRPRSSSVQMVVNEFFGERASSSRFAGMSALTTPSVSHTGSIARNGSLHGALSEAQVAVAVEGRSEHGGARGGAGGKGVMVDETMVPNPLFGGGSHAGQPTAAIDEDSELL